jgi:uncharacterized protein
MEAALHRFVRLLRLSGVRIGVSEAVDAMTAMAVPGIAADRELTRAALRTSLVKDRRDEDTFDWVFDRFFRLRAVAAGGEPGHGHAHDDLNDGGVLDRFTLSENAENTPQQGHSHGAPDDIAQYFDPADLAAQYNLHQEADRLDMASLTDEIVLSNDSPADAATAARVELATSRLRNPGRPHDLASGGGLRVDAELSVAQEAALLSWLSDQLDDDDGTGLTPDEIAALRRRLSGLIERLPAALRQHLETLLASGIDLESRGGRNQAAADRQDERERAALEESVRRLLRSVHGAPRPRRAIAARGSVDAARTMRHNMGFDGVPFLPVTVARAADRPRLVLLADVSLSVRSTARFTLELVHQLQDLAGKVRSFAFVEQVAEVTSLFDEHPPEHATRLLLSGLSDGGVLDVDADSDYGTALGSFLADHGSAVTRRTTLIVLGDGRGNGKDPNVGAFTELTRRARETIWLTPEPRYSWGLGQCDLPGYAAYCDRVYVVRDLHSLERVSTLRPRLAR